MASERRIPTLEGRKDKRRSFLPTPKSFAQSKETITQDYTRPVGQVENSRPLLIEHPRPLLQVGDKVCISGVKLGKLCYFGKTHIAPGIWCGIELDEPDGKHDGQVEGVRYFTCRQGHGIFAPAERVSRVDAPLHDLHNEIIEEESEVVESPVDNTPSAPLLTSRPHRRLLPQPQTFVRRGSKEQVDIPTKIEEQNEDTDEVEPPLQSQFADVVSTALNSKAKPGKRLPIIDGDQVRRISGVVASDPALNVVSGADDKENQVTAPSAVLGEGKLPAYKPSRLPGFSKLPQPPKRENPSAACPSDDTKDKPIVTKLNSTFTVQETITQNLEDIKSNSVESSSSDECLSGEVQECLGSDRRQFLNLTFDTESGNSPPRLIVASDETGTSNVVKHLDKTYVIDKKQLDVCKVEKLDEKEDELHHAEDVDVSANSSLGILNLKDIDLSASRIQIFNSSLGILDVSRSNISSDLLQEVQREDKNSNAQLTNSRNFSKVKTRIASLGEGFDVDGALTSTPLISSSLSKSRVKESSLSHLHSNSSQSLPRGRLPSTQEEVFDGECDDYFDEVMTDLNCTFDVNEEKEAEIEGGDTLDWRQEASDEEEVQEKLNESDEEESGNLRLLNFTHVIVKEGEGNKFTLGTSKEDSLIEKFNNLEINKEVMSQNTSLVVQKGQMPMTDSGISELGDARSMAGSTELRNEDLQGEQSNQAGDLETGPEETGDLETLLEDIGSRELQLQADLVAGHLKGDRPLSLYSTTSADTGYVPDTDSERGTVTANSPLDWTQKMVDSGMGQSGTSITMETSGLDQAYAQSFKNFQSGVMREPHRSSEESDSDIYSDTGTMLADSDTIKLDSDLENMSSYMKNVEGISVEDILPLEGTVSQEGTTVGEKETDQTDKGESVISDSVPVPEVVEDERVEADQQQDLVVANQKRESFQAANQNEGLIEEANPKLNVTIDITCSQEEKSVASENQDDGTKQDSDAESGQIPSENEEEEKSEEKKKKRKDKKGKGKKNIKKKQEEKVEHKKPNINVGSRLADYIKSPLPTKPKEEKENTEAAKNKRNLGYVRKAGKTDESEKGKSEGDEEKKTFKREKVEKEPPKIIKRAPPKSKWDAIMSKIEDRKTEPPVKKEVKSTLSAYLNSPPPAVVKKDSETKQKKKLPAVPTPDYSRVKSKLNLGATPPVIRREMSPGPGKRDQSPRNKGSRHSSISGAPGNAPPILDLNESVGSSVLGSAVESFRSSQPELRVGRAEEGTDGGLGSCPSTPKSVAKPANPVVSKITGRERRNSLSSTVSETSQASVKAASTKNLSQIDPQRRKSMPAKSTIPKQTTSPLRTNSPARSVDSAPTRVTQRVTTNKLAERSKSVPAPPRRAPNQSSTKQETSRKTTLSSKNKKDSNQNRNKTKTKNNQKPNQTSELVPASIGPQGKQEITRLEALCESRTKELTFAKIQMRANLQAFDAMSVLVNYLANDLSAFSCPSLKSQVTTLQEQLAKHKTQIEELETNKSSLEQEIVKLTDNSENNLKCLKEEHSTELSGLEQKWQEKFSSALTAAEKHHKQTVVDLVATHERQDAEMRGDHALMVQRLKIHHEEDVAALRTRQEAQMEELHKQHRDKLEDITKRFESIKMGLSEKVDTLRSECDDLRHRAKVSEEALLRDSDVKVKMALSPYLELPKEIDSLKLVIEMRNEEIQKLKNRNGDLEKQVEELLIAKEKIISQKQKIENLEAIISMKTDHEKQLHDKCQMLMKKYDKESKANKRLSMDFEELVWKVSQADPGSMENLSKLGGSPSGSENASPVVLRRKIQSPALSDAEKSPAKSAIYRRSVSSNDSSAEKKLKRRSANFLLEKDRTSPPSPLSKKHTSSESSSPQRSGLYCHVESPSKRNGRMAQSWNVEIHHEKKEEERLVQSCGDMDVFEAPQGLPHPPTPEEVKSSIQAAIIKSQGENTNTATSRSENHSSIINPSDVTVEFSLPLNHEGVELEEFEGEGLQLDTSGETRDETSDLSHSTESYCQSDVTSGTGSMIWDYEKMDSTKSMDSSQTSQTSDTLLDSNSTLTDSLKGESGTLTNIKDISPEENIHSGSDRQHLVKGNNSEVEEPNPPQRRKTVKESTV